MFTQDIHTEIFAEGVWDKRVQTEIVAALGRALNHKNSCVRTSAIEIFTGAIAQGALLFFSRNICTKISAGGCQGKIFDTEIVAALGCALNDIDFNIRRSAVQIFTAAVAQGELHCLHGIFIPKYSQRSFDTSCLILTLLPHL